MATAVAAVVDPFPMPFNPELVEFINSCVFLLGLVCVLMGTWIRIRIRRISQVRDSLSGEADQRMPGATIRLADVLHRRFSSR